MASKRFVQHFSVSCAHELSEAINRWLAEHPDMDMSISAAYPWRIPTVRRATGFSTTSTLF